MKVAGSIPAGSFGAVAQRIERHANVSHLSSRSFLLLGGNASGVPPRTCRRHCPLERPNGRRLRYLTFTLSPRMPAGLQCRGFESRLPFGAVAQLVEHERLAKPWSRFSFGANAGWNTGRASGKPEGPRSNSWWMAQAVHSSEQHLADFVALCSLRRECRWDYILTMIEVAGSNPARSTIRGGSSVVERAVSPILVAVSYVGFRHSLFPPGTNAVGTTSCKMTVSTNLVVPFSL